MCFGTGSILNEKSKQVSVGIQYMNQSMGKAILILLILLKDISNE